MSASGRYESSHPTVYDSIGRGYATQRVPDARIAARIDRALGAARTVCNVGAGTGSYELGDREVVAVEPSRGMISQRASRRRIARGVAEALPFRDAAFDAAIATLTIHHWQDARAGLAEMRRIARRSIVFTFDPDPDAHFWLVRDYIPEIADLDRGRALSIDAIRQAIGGGRVEVVPVPWDCSDGFLAASWRRPERYLDPAVRASISSLAQLPTDLVEAAMRRLARDLETGAWARRNADILERDEMDHGYRLISSEA